MSKLIFSIILPIILLSYIKGQDIEFEFGANLLVKTKDGQTFQLIRKTIDGSAKAVLDDIIVGEIKIHTNTEKGVKTEVLKLSGDFQNEFVGDGGTFTNTESNRNLDVITSTPSTRWPNSMIYYSTDPSFSSAMTAIIENAAWTWTHNSPMRFIKTSSSTNSVLLTPVSELECMSTIGYQGSGGQTLYLNDGGCMYGRVIHELGHAFGLNHENIRPDAGSFITVNWNNIMQGYQSNYQWTNGFLYGKNAYDYGSIEHYNLLGFSSNGKDTISVVQSSFKDYLSKYPNELPGSNLGQRSFLSTLDKQMTYGYLARCYNRAGSFSGPFWDIAPFGGCAVLCGTSYRQRLVSCRSSKGVCLPDWQCPKPKPAIFQSCELSAGNLQITFDDANWGDVGGVMDNVAFYDHYDWLIWSGYPFAGASDGNSFSGSLSTGPGKDSSSSGTGRYLMFYNIFPTKPGDQAWYESPVLGTTNAASCQVSFSWFIAGGNNKLQVQLSWCGDCKQDKVLWTGTSISNSWSQQSVTIPAFSSDVRLRFVAIAGSQLNSFVGLDNIVFSSSCIRNKNSTLPTGNMSYPYPPPVLSCAVINVQKAAVKLSLLSIILIAVGGGVFLLICVCAFECLWRRRKYKLILKADPNKKSKRAAKAHRRLSAMNVTNLNQMTRRTSTHRVESVYRMAPQMARDARETIRRMSFVTEPAADPRGSAGQLAQRTGPDGRPLFHRNMSIASTGDQQRGSIARQPSIRTSRMGRRRSSLRMSFTDVAEAVEETGFLDRIASVSNFFRGKASGPKRASVTESAASSTRNPVSSSRPNVKRENSVAIETQEGMRNWLGRSDSVVAHWLRRDSMSKEIPRRLSNNSCMPGSNRSTIDNHASSYRSYRHSRSQSSVSAMSENKDAEGLDVLKEEIDEDFPGV